MSLPRRRIAAVTTAALAITFAAASLARERESGDVPASAPPLAGSARWSLLAVGDTGAPPWPIARSRQQVMRVTRALAREDARAPVDALLLLGDNFYPDGLRREELEARVRANLREPFCRFLPADGVPCPLPGHPVPVFAVLGNHDHEHAESPQLQRGELPRRIPGFVLPAGPAQVLELGHGVSLVLYDARELRERGSFEPLRAALRESAGPWRIVAGHYPLTRRPSDHEGRAALAALAGIDVPVHLHLAGHRHYLELARTETVPFLQAIAGSGSNVRPRKTPLDGSVYQAEEPGFVRVDLVGGAGGDHLVVSLFALSGSLLSDGPARVAARGWVTLDGAGGASALAAP